jgi:hypothetical protein
MLVGELHSFGAVAGFGNDLDAGASQQTCQPCSHHFMIVGY